MQPIERVGVFALIFLVVMIVAVVMFDREADGLGSEVAAKDKSAAAQLDPMTPQDVGQLGQTTRPKQGAASGGKPQQAKTKGKYSAHRKPKSKPTQIANRGLPVSTPKPALTPAPKPITSTSLNSGRHTPANKPGAGSKSKQSAAAFSPDKAVLSPQQASRANPQTSLLKPKTSSTALGSYVVKAGDTLSEISLSQLGTSTRWREIEQLNGVSPNQLSVGMKLRLPAGGIASNAPASNPTRSKTTTPKSKSKSSAGYRVGNGDSLWLIAKRQLGDGNRWSEIASLNSEINPNRLVVGTTLAMPTGAQRPTRTAKSTPTTDRASSKKPRVR